MVLLYQENYLCIYVSFLDGNQGLSTLTSSDSRKDTMPCRMEVFCTRWCLTHSLLGPCSVFFRSLEYTLYSWLICCNLGWWIPFSCSRSIYIYIHVSCRNVWLCRIHMVLHLYLYLSTHPSIHISIFIYTYMMVSWNRGTPSHHPFIDGVFPNKNQPFLRYPIYGNSQMNNMGIYPLVMEKVRLTP